MSANVLVDHYRCPERYNTPLAFDASGVVENLRLERYMDSNGNGRQNSTFWQVARNAYHLLRPLMGVAFRKHLQRAYLKGWQDITFPHWPVDRTVECILERLAMITLDSRGESQMPFVWFWPRGYSGCVILTHDVDSQAGHDFSPQLADIDSFYGFKSAFQIVPEERYVVSESFLESLRSRGCEINVHGLNHDGRLFETRKTFLERVQKINRYARDYGAAGFRSPVLYRNLDWYGDFEFSYDMSVPNCAHLDPQRGGCCTVTPYFIGDVLELPLTMTQDYSMFHYLRDHSIELWKRQISLVLEKNGLISFNIHPDYVDEQPYRDIYYELLEYLKGVCRDRNIWIALPDEVNQWWRQRSSIRITETGNQIELSGPGNDEAVLAMAWVNQGNLTYDFSWRAGLKTGRDTCVFA